MTCPTHPRHFMLNILERRALLLAHTSRQPICRSLHGSVVRQEASGSEYRSAAHLHSDDPSPESFGASPSSRASKSRRSIAEPTFDLSDIFPSSSSTLSASAIKQSSVRVGEGPLSGNGWTEEGLNTLVSGGTFSSPSSYKSGGEVPSPPQRGGQPRRFGLQSNYVDSPRNFRGVHSRDRRAGGHTPAEAAAFNEVLQSIFADLERTNSPLRNGSDTSPDPYGAQYAMGGNIFRSRIAARRSSPLEALDLELDSETMNEVDQLKEEMSALGSDADVLEWAKKKVFTPKEVIEGEQFFSAAYPHILAHTIRTVRSHFNNPHLALALFQYAQMHSLESYLSGCLTEAYNEVLTIRWESFRDIEGVEMAVREMDSNGVGWDRETRAVVGKVCETVSQSLVSGNGEWDEQAEERLRSLEKRIEVDMLREEQIHADKKKRSAKLNEGAFRQPSSFASPSQKTRPGSLRKSFGLLAHPA